MHRFIRLAPVAYPAAVLLLMLPGLAVGPSFDAGIFSTIGWRLLEGDALYADVWDHKPPGAYLPYVLAHAITQDPDVVWAIVWSLTVTSLVSAMILLDRRLRSVGAGGGASGAAALLGGLGAGAYMITLGGGLSESFALLPLAAAIFAASSRRLVVAGVATGIAIGVSLQAVPVLVAIAVIVMGNGAWQRAARLAAGIGLVALIAALGLWWNGALADAPDALLGYSAAYRAVAARGGGDSPWGLVPWTLLVVLPLLFGIGLAVVYRRLVAPRLALASAAWLVAGVLLILVQGRFYAHYATPLVLPATILTGLGLHAAAASLRRGPVLMGVPVALTVAIALVVGAAGAADEQGPFQASNERAAAVAGEVARLTQPGDQVLVWGNSARIYELARREPATRYVYFYPLLTPGYVTEARIAGVLAEIEAASPAAVVDSGSPEPGAPGLPALLIDRPLATDGRDADLLDPLRRYVEERSLPADVVSGWPIYFAR